jgi:hypothetical protein
MSHMKELAYARYKKQFVKYSNLNRHSDGVKALIREGRGLRKVRENHLNVGPRIDLQ